MQGIARRGSRGFTLVEILIAMGVFLIGVVSIIAVFPQGLATTSKSVDDSMAASVVQSLFDALVDGVKRNAVDEKTKTSQPTGRYWVRFFHDGLPADGASFELARTTPDDKTTIAKPDAPNEYYDLPNYLNPGQNTNSSMLVPVDVGKAGTPPFDSVSLLRGWWFPDTSIDSWDNCLDPTQTRNGGGLGSKNWGVPVVQMGSLQGTTDIPSTRDSANAMFPDPLRQYSFNFLAEIHQDLTPGGDNLGSASNPQPNIPSTPDERKGEWKLFEPWYGNQAQIKLAKGYRPGCERISFYFFKSWTPACTGAGQSLAQIQRDQVREESPATVRMFQFLVSFTQ